MLQRLRYPRHLAVVVGLFALAARSAPVTAQERDPSEGTTSVKSETPPGEETTAEDVLRALKRNRPPNDVIRSTGSTAHLHGVAHRLLPEGASVIDRAGHIEQRDDGWVFVSDDTDDPLPLLRNATLEVVVRTAAGAPAPMSFVVSGEVSVFRGRNYLLLRSAMRANRPAPRVPKTIPHPAPSPGGDAHHAPPSAESVLEAMRAERPEREAIASGDPLKSAAPDSRSMTAPLTGSSGGLGQPGSADAEAHRTLQPDGTILPRRAGRVTAQGDRWFFNAESDHPDRPEPPRELLPCRATEFMLTRWEANPHGLVFVVTGEITLFDGVNYLLPRVAIRQPASDNLRR